MKSSYPLRIMSAAAAFLILISASACGEASDAPVSSTAAPDAGTEAVTEPEGPVYLDSLPDDLDFGGTEIRFVSSFETSNIALSEEDDTGDVVNAALWQRNSEIESRFGLKIKLVATTGYDSFNKTVTNSITAGSDDYDVFCGHTRFNVNLASKNYLINLNGVENLNLDAPYWSQLYNSNVNYKDNYYWITGDITNNFIAYIYAMFCNTTMWADYYTGDDIYTVIDSGTWTLDKLSEYSEGVYTDLNGDGQQGNEDVWGLVMQEGHILNGMSFAAGVVYTSVGEDGRYVVSVNNEHTIDVFNKMHSMFFDHDFCRLMPNAEYDTPALEMFSEGRVLFMPATFGVAGNKLTRNMQNDFTIIPFPKYDESQELYRVNQYDGVPIYGIPITASADRLPAIGYALEAMCSMNSSIVIPAYYEIALKNKYTRDEKTAKMIDLVHDSVAVDFSFAWGDTISGIYEIFYGNIKKDSIASVLEKSMKKWDKNMTKLMDALEGEG